MTPAQTPLTESERIELEDAFIDKFRYVRSRGRTPPRNLTIIETPDGDE